MAVPAHAAAAGDPPATGDSVVLIVHAAGDAADVQATAADAASSTIDVRHTLPTEHAFSVEVPAGQQAAAEAALRATPGVTGVEAPVTRSFSAIPNDPNYSSEKAYLASVDAPAAWDRTHGAASVKIAVVDSGIDVNHEDLSSKIAGKYNADNGSTNITDDIGHGTFVAGVAAAATNNGHGIAGAGYDTSLLGVKIADSSDELTVDDEIRGINWAVAHGADIINLSLGGTDYSAAEKAAVENAIARGVLVVAAAGNDATTVKQYPAAYPGVIAVGAVDTATNKRASFSSYGSWVTLAAPGVNIEGTTPTKGSEFFPAGRYAKADGTSFSSPLVAGAAALLKASNPDLTVTQLRHALVASAGGFAGQGLGAGQVDFARALDHVPPAAGPASAAVSGTGDRITLRATSASPTVEFRLDSGAWTAPTATSGGAATTQFPTWGYADGDHTVHVRACSAYGECGTAEATTTVQLSNTAPTFTGPTAGATVSGRFTVTATHASGGGARLLVDGKPAGFAPSSPYSFVVNGSQLTDDSHTLQTVLCSTSGSLCAGPTSAPLQVSNDSLRPTITALTNPAISPNGDGSGDTATLHYTLDTAQTVTVETLDSSGTVVRSDPVSNPQVGANVWTWRGVATNGTRLPDGRYTIALVTQRGQGGGYPTLSGYAETVGTIDTVSPRLSGLTGAGVTFYPVHDGYRDYFTPGVTASKAGRVVLTIRSGRGAVVRTLSANRSAGRTALVWNGRDAHGRLVAAGRYRWQYSITDAAGNRTLAAAATVGVSARRLVAEVAYVWHRGSTYRYAGGTDPCATARKARSAFPHGVDLRNACSPGSGDFAYASYRFTVPKAIRYARVTVQAYGRSTHRPSQLSVAVDRTDGGVEIPSYVKVSRTGNHWYSLASVPAAGHITGGRYAYASLLLTGRYKGANDFDLKYTRLRVSYTVLR